MKRIDEFDFVETHFGKIQTGSLVKAIKTGLRIISTAPVIYIIIDLRRCKMMDDEAIRKIRHYFDLSKRIRRIKIITKTAEIIDFSK